MAATATAGRLTEAHRVAQTRLAAQTIIQMGAVWHLLDGDQLDATLERWLVAALPIIQRQRSLSSRLAAGYLGMFKSSELGDSATVDPLLAGDAPTGALTTSLVVTGPAAIKRAMTRGSTLPEAMSTAQGTAAAAAMRHVLDGGRTTIHDTVDADREALGYARATSGKACGFCAMLASRGPVYKSEKSAGKGKDWHDGCHCEPEPVYRDDAAWPAGSDRYRDLWQQASEADGDTATVFRQLVSA